MIEKRNNGIDILRFVLMFMICILHVLGQGGVIKASETGSIQNNLFWLLEVICFGAVDCFALISGYIAKDKRQKYDKIVNIWFQVFFYSFILNSIFTIFGINKDLSLRFILKSIFPISFNVFWYMSSYFILFMILPILNNYIFKIDEKDAKRAFIIIIFIFSCMGLLSDAFNLKAGYSPIWLIILYVLGALMKKIKLFENRKTFVLIIIWLVSLAITYFVHIYYESDLLLNYISPTILLSSLIIVVLFTRIKTENNNISKIAPYCLGIYLFQLNPIIWNIIIKNKLTFITNNSICISLLLVFLWALLIFIIGFVIEIIRSKLSILLKIPELSKKIVNLVKTILDKVIKLI